MAIYRLLDYYTGWYCNVSMRQVWQFLGFDFSDLFFQQVEEANERRRSLFTDYSKSPKTTYGFYFGSIYVGMHSDDYIRSTFICGCNDDSDRLSICDEPGKIYVVLSGSALSDLRTRLDDLDYRLFHPEEYFDINPRLQERAEKNGAAVDLKSLKLQVDLTRLDVAFDFINEYNDIYSQFANYCYWLDKCHYKRTASDHNGGGVIYESRFGKERSVYFGTTGTKLLRVYDKMFQLAPSGILLDDRSYPYSEDIPVKDLKSWMRVEYQTRRKYSEVCWEYLKYRDDFRDAWYLVCDEFTMLVPDDHKPRSEWKKLDICEQIFNYDFVPRISLNNHKVQKTKLPFDAAVESIRRALPSINGLIASLGINGFIELVNNLNAELVDASLGSPLAKLRLIRNREKANAIIEDSKVGFENIYLSYGENGAFVFPLLVDQDGCLVENRDSDDIWLIKQNNLSLKINNDSLNKDLEFYTLFFENLKRRNGMEFSRDMSDALYDTVSYLGYKPADLR